MPEEVQWLLIGVSGPTCAGKTTLATLLRDVLLNNKSLQISGRNYKINEVKILCQDAYFLPADDARHLWLKSINHINWETVTAMDMPRMINDIATTVKDEGYLLGRGGSASSTLSVMILDGFVLFNQPQIVELCQLKYHLHIPHQECYARRKARVYKHPDAPGYFELAVWPMYEKNFAEYKDRDDIVVLNGELSAQCLLEYVLNAVEEFQ